MIKEHLHIEFLSFLQIAVKRIPIETVKRTAQNLPLEVVLMQMVGRDQSVPEETSSFSVELLDWSEQQQKLVLVMERPLPCSDLFDYIEERGCLQEQEAKVLLRQLVEGMIQVHTRGVLHRDLKPENLLVQTGAEGPLLRLMDFGCGCLIGEDSYTEFDGMDLKTFCRSWQNCGEALSSL
ncbi:serine/threonine-protein kinase pim-2-like [Astyanax mexicanus]|uniref:non-specific serine/threonine protein kinase n=1 Tax=Astyanax mexicanus TaxID=7994 RepID=A0A8T2MMI5_ASTMX|nr:serine/threonine-protein kinase pim-2-like [Astyanax mexicanus]